MFDKITLFSFLFNLLNIAFYFSLSKGEICSTATWSKDGITVAGGKDYGDKLDQLAHPYGIFLDDNDDTIYIADHDNDRIVMWKQNATIGQWVAGVKDKDTTEKFSLFMPEDMVVDKNGTIYISDSGNHRVVRWYRGEDDGEVLIDNIQSYGIGQDNQGFIYVSEYADGTTTKWNFNDNEFGGEIVASRLRQSCLIFVDQKRTIYSTGYLTHRIVKIIEGNDEPILVAGQSDKSGDDFDKFDEPSGVYVDEQETIYVADSGNHRIMRWLRDATNGTLIAGGNGRGSSPDQFDLPSDVSLDREGNLYVTDMINNRRNISTPPFSFFFGHFKTLWNVPSSYRQLENWTKQYGKIYGIYEGTHPVLVVSDPDFLQEVFIKQFSVFHVRMITMLEDIGHNLAFSNGSPWRRQRHVINPSFTAIKLKTMSPLINGAISDVMDKLLEHSNSGDEFNIYLYYKRLTMDIICRCAFGIDIDLQHNPNHIYLNKLEGLFDNHSVMKSPIFKVTQLIPEIKNILGRLYVVHNTVRKYINTKVLPLISSTKQLDESAYMWLQNRLHTIVEQRQETPISRKDLLQLMLQVMTKEPIQDTTEDDSKTNYRLSEDEVVGNTLIFMAAGYETTSTALAYATYVLAKYPDVLKKLQDEIDQLPIDNDDTTDDKKIKEYPDYDTVTHLSYMDMFISEVLRMYPITNIAIQRCAMENTVVQGIDIEKGTSVYPDIYSIQYDRELWGPDDPYIFLPERHKIKRHPMAFMAFGAGPRNCIGMRFALIEMKMLLTRLLREYTILPGEHLEKNFNIHEELLMVPEAIWIKLLKRET
ncbi:unnamed protein product [Adineta steineri]|uniref:Cytochrome P450 n=1 Tax=Adineta steineri TaxID=433720 RepID=A0A814KZW4_9BILA|nr:unnamed protein product [Adineta steineri]CAF4051532.1 unnamed protein product [Adineta steineri]